jgi:hypothetical protein
MQLLKMFHKKTEEISSLWLGKYFLDMTLRSMIDKRKYMIHLDFVNILKISSSKDNSIRMSCT